ncbi:MAG: Gfo/Idh/MocA family oxidoreductase [Pirellulales bacterium]|nr:Gfo/Idh/MocA family oxidoreductase [Pirellulales bacterium]
MNLTPEEKAVGKENFCAAIGSDVKDKHGESRRDFLKKGIMAGVVSGGGLGAFYFGYKGAIADPVRVGVIGTGDEGSVLIGAINPEFIEVKSIADIRPYNQYRAFHGDCYSPAAQKVRCGLLKKYGWATENEARKQVKVYGPYEELIANAKADGIEAVIIALPLHLHCPAAIAAMEAGLHVLTEKLMAHSVAQCKQMARVAKQTHRHLATGHQRHYNILYDNAVDQIRRGLLGELHFVRAQWHRGNLPGTDSWQQPMPEKLKPDDSQAARLQKELVSWKRKLESVTTTKEIEEWQAKVAQKKAQIADELLDGKVEGYGYEAKKYKDADGKVIYDRPAAEELIRWRLWDRTGGGLMAELGSHQLDAASIFISAVHDGVKQYPLNVAAAANRPLFPQDRDVNDHVYCIYEFPAPGYDPASPVDSRKKIGVQYSSINGNGFGGYGEMVFGTNGTLILEREQEAMLFATGSASSKINVTQDKDGDGPTMDTQASGEEPAAVGKMATLDVSRGYTEEEEHWAWCIRNNPQNEDPDLQPKCYPKVAMADAVIALTTNIAARRGMRVEFKKEWFDPDDDATPEADLGT